MKYLIITIVFLITLIPIYSQKAKILIDNRDTLLCLDKEGSKKIILLHKENEKLQELNNINEQIIINLNDKVLIQDSIITSQKNIINNYSLIFNNYSLKETEYKNQIDNLSNSLRNEIKRNKINTRLYIFSVSILGIITIWALK